MTDLTLIEGGAEEVSAIQMAASQLGLASDETPLYGVTLLAFSTPEGRDLYGYAHYGDPTSSQLLALLDLTHFEMMQQTAGVL